MQGFTQQIFSIELLLCAKKLCQEFGIEQYVTIKSMPSQSIHSSGSERQ